MIINHSVKRYRTLFNWKNSFRRGEGSRKFIAKSLLLSYNGQRESSFLCSKNLGGTRVKQSTISTVEIRKNVTPFLMFQDGKAEEAMNYYTSLIEDSEITSISHYGSNENGKEGTVMHATFSLKGQAFMCIDSVSQLPTT